MGPDVWCVIPVYNNAATVREVALAARSLLSQVLVVDDGSTDTCVTDLLKNTGVHVIRHEKNRGKGRALLTALDFTAKQNARWMITLDADGQHRPADLAKFFPLLDDENALIIGCRDFTQPNIPGKSRFGRDFGNFWLRIETGRQINDCQSGFRAYPVRHFTRMRFSGSFYDFETEALARAAWAGLHFKEVEVDVYYPEAGRRVTHFHPLRDNLRISWMHTRLVLRHLLPLPHRKLVRPEKNSVDMSLFRHPVRFLKLLLSENVSPGGLAASAAVGLILGTLPLIFTHTVAILYVTARLHLNKIMAVAIQNVCNPPVVPFLCIELGHWMLHGRWLTNVAPEAFVGRIPEFLGYWLLGSLVLAPVLAAAGGAVVFWAARKIQTSRERREVPLAV